MGMLECFVHPFSALCAVSFEHLSLTLEIVPVLSPVVMLSSCLLASHPSIISLSCFLRGAIFLLARSEPRDAIFLLARSEPLHHLALFFITILQHLFGFLSSRKLPNSQIQKKNMSKQLDCIIPAHSDKMHDTTLQVARAAHSQKQLRFPAAPESSAESSHYPTLPRLQAWRAPASSCSSARRCPCCVYQGGRAEATP